MEKILPHQRKRRNKLITRKKSSPNPSRGFTLVEVMIVLGIIAAVLALGLSRIKRKDNNIKTVTRHMRVLVKETRNRARLTSSTLRIVIQLENDKPSYWVEFGSGQQLRESSEQRKKREEAEKDKKDDKEKTAAAFSRDEKLTKKPIQLPKGLFFGAVDVQGNKEPTTEGTEFIYFSPEGFVEPSAIQITDKKNLTWTLAISPLTGQVDIIPEAKTLKELQR